MSTRFSALYRTLCVALAAQGMATCANAIRPSDCQARDADSTCASAVASAPPASDPPSSFTRSIYNNALGGVPASGYAYWGFDFVSDAAGVPSPVPDDMFINRSSVPVTITLSFDFPIDHPCNRDCLPGVQFEVDAGWIDVRPPYVIAGNTVSLSTQIRPGQSYGWVIGLWQSSNPRLKVSVPSGSAVSMADVGLPIDLSTALEIPAVIGTCECSDGSIAPCSLGTRFSNGLMGPWYRSNDFYVRRGSFNDCPRNN
jgi:hypothetical protein